MRPLVDVVAFRIETLDARSTTGRPLRAVYGDLTRHGHVVVKVAATQVRNEQAPLRILRQCVWRVELAGAAAPGANRFDELAVGGKPHEAGIPVAVGDDDVAVALHNHRGGTVEVTFIGAPFAERAEAQ